MLAGFQIFFVCHKSWPRKLKRHCPPRACLFKSSCEVLQRRKTHRHIWDKSEMRSMPIEFAAAVIVCFDICLNLLHRILRLPTPTLHPNTATVYNIYIYMSVHKKYLNRKSFAITVVVPESPAHLLYYVIMYHCCIVYNYNVVTASNEPNIIYFVFPIRRAVVEIM